MTVNKGSPEFFTNLDVLMSWGECTKIEKIYRPHNEQWGLPLESRITSYLALDDFRQITEAATYRALEHGNGSVFVRQDKGEILIQDQDTMYNHLLYAESQKFKLFAGLAYSGVLNPARLDIKLQGDDIVEIFLDIANIIKRAERCQFCAKGGEQVPAGYDLVSQFMLKYPRHWSRKIVQYVLYGDNLILAAVGAIRNQLELPHLHGKISRREADKFFGSF